ncbi:ERF family protein [Rathayibacter festucae]|uniref:Uncharacterized protein n=1 Tax=Rathayibacter festucae DSM 15932 TaxID=1328866 RepID=A0A3Q9UYL0_9MICO|nr:ERF family protein [Rathayibacter festucae]AZZ51408.1 hypothetical protein C1I64_04700 [Rathayibacter festucae DSM 15932]
MAEEVPAPKKLAEALVAFRAVMPVVKRGTSGQAGSRAYKYADLATVEETAQPHLAANKLAITQPINTEENGFTYLSTVIRHESGESETSRLRIPIEGLRPQEVGSMITYYRRYAFTTNLGIAIEGEDDDGDAAEGSKVAVSRKPAPSTTKPASESQVTLIESLAKRKGKDDEWVLSTLEKVKSSAHASTVIDKLQELEDAQ